MLVSFDTYTKLRKPANFVQRLVDTWNLYWWSKCWYDNPSGGGYRLRVPITTWKSAWHSSQYMD